MTRVRVSQKLWYNPHKVGRKTNEERARIKELTRFRVKRGKFLVIFDDIDDDDNIKKFDLDIQKNLNFKPTSTEKKI